MEPRCQVDSGYEEDVNLGKSDTTLLPGVSHSESDSIDKRIEYMIGVVGYKDRIVMHDQGHHTT